METVKSITYPNTDYYQWGCNCRLNGYGQKATEKVINEPSNDVAYNTTQSDRDLFWSGYYQTPEKVRFTVGKNGNLYCRKCKGEIKVLSEYDPKTNTFKGECSCYKGDFTPYTNHCYIKGCSGGVNSLWSKKSRIPSMGYHCDVCGEDLTRYFRKKKVVTYNPDRSFHF